MTVKIKRSNLKSFFGINLGLLIVAAGAVFFKNPNRFALGGVSGISLLISHYFPDWKIGALMLLLNAAILLLGLLFLGKSVIIKSVYSSLALSGMVWAMEALFPLTAPLSNQKLVELIYGVFLPGIGSALVFNLGSTTGGTDIIAKILSKHFKIRVSLSLLFTDFFIALSAGFIFGVESGLFSVLGVCTKVFALDLVLESLHVSKICVVISCESEKVKEFILNDLKKDATINEAKGAYTGEGKEVITTVLTRRQARRLREFVTRIDGGAFITITNSSRIIGKGFDNAD